MEIEVAAEQIQRESFHSTVGDLSRNRNSDTRIRREGHLQSLIRCSVNRRRESANLNPLVFATIFTISREARRLKMPNITLKQNPAMLHIDTLSR